VLSTLLDLLCGIVVKSSWLQIQRSEFDSRRYQIFWEVVCLERGPLSLVSTTEELLGRKSSGTGLENREYGRRDPSRWPLVILYPQKLALTSTTSGGRSVGIVRSRTQATECFLLFWYLPLKNIICISSLYESAILCAFMEESHLCQWSIIWLQCPGSYE
jgi:hypothetical protein